MEYDFELQIAQTDREFAKKQRMIALVLAVLSVVAVFLGIGYGVIPQTYIVSEESKPYVPFSASTSKGEYLMVRGITSCLKLGEISIQPMGTITGVPIGSSRGLVHTDVYMVSDGEIVFPVYVPSREEFNPDPETTIYGSAYYLSKTTYAQNIEAFELVETLSETCGLMVHEQKFTTITETKNVLRPLPLWGFLGATVVLLALCIFFVVRAVTAENRAYKSMQKVLEGHDETA